MADPSDRPVPATGPRSGSATAAAHGPANVPCPECGEMVRPGLVRCWSCGAFMREDVAARFAQMSRERPEVEYQPLHELNAGGSREGQAGPRRTSADDADFELSGQFAAPRREDLKPSPAAPPAAANDSEDDDEFTLDDAGARHFSAAAPAGPASSAEPAEPESDTDGHASEDRDTGRAGDAVGSTPPAKSAPDESVAPAAEAQRKSGADADEVAHSEAAGGDVLLEIAMRESGGNRRRGLRIRGDKILLHCPAGHPVKVARKHGGKVGRCPHPGCGLRYLVPDIPLDPDEVAAEVESAAGAAGAAARAPAGPPDELAAGKFSRYVADVRMHTVVPANVKPKADSQAKAFRPADLALSPDALLVLTLEGKKGMFGMGGQKPGAIRGTIRETLAADEPDLSSLPAPHLLLAGENAAEVAVEYPTALPHESKFGGEPVFGTGRIALRLPRTGGEADADQAPETRETTFLSLTLSQFRRFAAAMNEFGFAPGSGNRYGADTPIPLTDDAPVHAGHYTDAEVPELPRPDLYLADDQLKAVVSGYRCVSCGLIVSEDGRKKEKLGGANGKGLAKAKCPKCGETFGDEPLYKLAKS